MIKIAIPHPKMAQLVNMVVQLSALQNQIIKINFIQVELQAHPHQVMAPHRFIVVV